MNHISTKCIFLKIEYKNINFLLMLAGQHMLIFYNKIEKYLHAGLKMQSGSDKNEAIFMWPSCIFE